MGAETLVYVRVLVPTEKWIEVSAIGRHEAEVIAASLPNVLRILEATYEQPDQGRDGA